MLFWTQDYEDCGLSYGWSLVVIQGWGSHAFKIELEFLPNSLQDEGSEFVTETFHKPLTVILWWPCV